jgi:hypothetical protein
VDSEVTTGLILKIFLDSFEFYDSELDSIVLRLRRKKKISVLRGEILAKFHANSLLGSMNIGVIFDIEDMEGSDKTEQLNAAIWSAKITYYQGSRIVLESREHLLSQHQVVMDSQLVVRPVLLDFDRLIRELQATSILEQDQMSLDSDAAQSVGSLSRIGDVDDQDI